MKPFVLASIGLCLAGLLSGCATHYYRTNDRGTTLFLRLPEAKSVALFTSIDGFRPRPAVLAKGCWIVTQPTTEEFAYFYKVDGELLIPDCRFKEQDDFGQENCIFLPGQ